MMMMGDNKHLRKQDEIKTQKTTSVSGEFCPSEDEDSGPTDFPSMEKNKSVVMESGSSKKGVSSSRKKSQNPKSKVKQACVGNSKKPRSAPRKRTRYSDLYDDAEAKFSCMERADRVLTRLENELKLPFFLKCMLPSNVSHGFWLHLPRKFCGVHLPNNDTSIILVDEWGNEYKTSYLLERHGLSAGWRGFSIAHRLLKGDILIFHLMAPCKLQVHIVRANDSDVVSAALCLVNFDAFREGTGAEVSEKKDKRKRKRTTKYVEPFLPDMSTPSENVKRENVQDQSASNSSDGFNYEVVEDSEIGIHRRSKNAIFYPEPSFLHEHSREGLVCT